MTDIAQLVERWNEAHAEMSAFARHREGCYYLRAECVCGYRPAVSQARIADKAILDALQQQAARITELAAELECVRKDAERWRHIRKAPINGGVRDWLHMPHTEELDASIDTAIAESDNASLARGVIPAHLAEPDGAAKAIAAAIEARRNRQPSEIERLRAELSALRAELEGAKRDAERLNWLSARHVEVRDLLRYGVGNRVLVCAPDLEESSSNLRAHIDAAIAQEVKP